MGCEKAAGEKRDSAKRGSGIFSGSGIQLGVLSPTSLCVYNHLCRHHPGTAAFAAPAAAG